MPTRPPRDPNGPHVRVYHSLLFSPAWRCLSYSARALFLDGRAHLTSTNNGNVDLTLSRLKHRGWNSSSTLSKARYELIALGFMAATVEGGLRQGTRVPTLYRFTDLPVYEHPKLGISPIAATHDYRKHATLAQARVARAEGMKALYERGKTKQLRKVPRVRKPNPIGSILERDSPPSGSNFKH